MFPQTTQKIIPLQPIKLHFTNCVCAVRLLNCMLKSITFHFILHCHKIMVSSDKMYFPSNNTLLRWFCTQRLQNNDDHNNKLVSPDPLCGFPVCLLQSSWAGFMKCKGKAFIRWRLSQALSLRACVPGPVNLSNSLLKGSEFFTLAGTYSEGNNIWKDDII